MILYRLIEGPRHFDEAPYTRIAILGVATGLVIAALSAATDGPIPLDLTMLEMFSLAVALCTIAAVGSAVLFRLLTQGWSSLSLGGMG